MEDLNLNMANSKEEFREKFRKKARKECTGIMEVMEAYQKLMEKATNETEKDIIYIGTNFIVHQI